MEQKTLKSSYDGLDISINEYLTDNAKANILIIHGMIEHAKRYDDFAKFLNAHNYNVYTFDKRGHGTSRNEYITYGYFGSNGDKALLNDILEIITYIKEKSNLTLNLFAHSMGTIETRCFMQLNSHLVNKIVLSGAPNYQAGTKLGIILAKILCLGNGERKSSKLIYHLSLGAFARKVKNSKTNVDWLSYNEENVKNYQNDPHCSFSFTNNGYLTLFTLVNQMHKSNLYISTKENPILFICGEDDPCTGYEKGIKSSIRTLNKAGYNNIDKIILPKMRHEILQEINKEEVYKDVLEFYER